MEVMARVFAAALVFVIASAHAQSITPLVVKPIDTFESHGRAVLDTIVRFGIENRVPLSIVLADDHLCSTKVELTVRNQALADVVDAVLTHVEGYQWSIKDSVLSIQPRSFPSSTAKLLTTQIPQFRVGPTTTQDLELELWMFTGAVINPQKGYNMSHLESVDSPRISRIEMDNATLEQILNHLVKQDLGGAWILLPVSDDYEKDLRPFVKIINYSDKYAGQRSPCDAVISKP